MVHRPRGPRVRVYRPRYRPFHVEGDNLTSSVVVVSFQPTEWLARCLDSVVGQADEVILVDNGSKGGAAAAHERPGVQVLRLAENQGFASGVNAGVATARGDIVALLNDDAVAGPGWLETAERLLEISDIAAVGPRILLARRFAEIALDDDEHFVPGDGRALGRRLSSATLDGEDVLSALVGPGVHSLEQAPDGERWRWTAGRRCFYVPMPGEPGSPSWLAGDVPGDLPKLELNREPVPLRRVVDLVNSAGSYLRKDGYAGDCGAELPDEDRWSLPRECFAVSGTALVTTSAVLGRVGPFESSYFAYYEDTDWCWRARLQGYRVMYSPASTVRHVRGQTSGGTLAARTRFLAERNRILTLARCAPLWLAVREARRKRSGGGDDGVAEVLSHSFPAALAQRARLRRNWAVPSREVYNRWAGVDVPGGDGT
ncbi:MAG: glycosyltransferase family 2 protein [Acidimicrobiales bacterium]